jgi:hypothetical protein
MLYGSFKEIDRLQYPYIENYVAVSQKYIYLNHEVQEILQSPQSRLNIIWKALGYNAKFLHTTVVEISRCDLSHLV